MPDSINEATKAIQSIKLNPRLEEQARRLSEVLNNNIMELFHGEQILTQSF